MAPPAAAPKPVVTPRDIITQVMDELMDEGATAAEALICIPQAISDAKTAATDIATKIDDKVYCRHPASCGNERWMKNAGFFKSCVKRGKEVCPTCRLVEVSAAEIFVRGEPRSERGAVVGRSLCCV
jgi:hypothetical protein